MGQEPGLIWRIMQRLNRRVAHNYQRGIGPASVVMLLTTTGRKSGLPRITPLQFEEYDGIFYLGSARGAAADWFQNIRANPRVRVQIRQRQFTGAAEAVTQPGRVADFLELRLKRHPCMIGLLMRLEGLPFRYTRQDLEYFAAQKAMVVIRPDPEVTENRPP
jgi:deazaflavin-dependent oxidoreductase (nitroreductase family)